MCGFDRSTQGMSAERRVQGDLAHLLARGCIRGIVSFAGLMTGLPGTMPLNGTQGVHMQASETFSVQV